MMYNREQAIDIYLRLMVHPDKDKYQETIYRLEEFLYRTNPERTRAASSVGQRKKVSK